MINKAKDIQDYRSTQQRLNDIKKEKIKKQRVLIMIMVVAVIAGWILK